MYGVCDPLIRLNHLGNRFSDEIKCSNSINLTHSFQILPYVIPLPVEYFSFGLYISSEAERTENEEKKNEREKHVRYGVH